MEQLIILAVLIGISALHGWWKKRQGESEDESESGPAQPPQRRTARPPNPAASWEEELRRLLQGEQQPGRPQPPVIAQAPPPLPPVASSRPAPIWRPAPVPQGDSDMAKGLSASTRISEHSSHAILGVTSPESRVAEHMQRVGQQVTTHRKWEVKKEIAPEIRQAISLVRDRQSQRAAIIAGIVLGPPKAIEG